LPISQAFFCFDEKRQLLQSLHCFSRLFILVERGRNITLAYTSQIVVMKNQRQWAVENDRVAYNGLIQVAELGLPLAFSSGYKINIRREAREQ
jgi:hypothetical protein